METTRRIAKTTKTTTERLQFLRLLVFVVLCSSLFGSNNVSSSFTVEPNHRNFIRGTGLPQQQQQQQQHHQQKPPQQCGSGTHFSTTCGFTRLSSTAARSSTSSKTTESIEADSASTSSTARTQQQQQEREMILPWRDTNYSPLTGTELRNLVVEAARREEEEVLENDETDDDDGFLDVPGVAWMEHLNLIVGDDRKMAENFYLGVLGMSADRSGSFHVNLGRQQFHLATPRSNTDEIPHRIHGSVGLVIPDLTTLWERLKNTYRDNEDKDHDGNNDDSNKSHGRGTTEHRRYDFRGTLFDFYRETAPHHDDEKGRALSPETTLVHVRCPWGNVFRCYSASARGRSSITSTSSSSQEEEQPVSPQMMTNLHATGIGIHGADKLGVLGVGQPGIRYVEFVLPAGVAAEKVRQFYQQTLRCPTSVLSTTIGSDGSSNGNNNKSCLVSVGPGVHLVFVEAAAAAASATQVELERDLYGRMKGIHVCIYAHDFRGLYRRLTDRSLVWTNPRFTRLDTCDTWGDARRSRTLRFKTLVDLDEAPLDDDKSTTAQEQQQQQHVVLMELEHETRPLRHGQFMKVPYYEPI